MSMLTAIKAKRSGPDGVATMPPPRVLARPKRRPALIAGATALIVVSGAAGAVAYQHAGARVPVVVVTQAVAPGQTLQAADLATANVSPTSQLQTVPSSSLRSMIGQQASTGLVPGQLLVPSDVTPQLLPGAGQVVVGFSLKPGQAPAQAFTPGTNVLIVASVASSSQATTVTPSQVLGGGVVVSVPGSVTGSAASSGQDVSVVVKQSNAAVVSAAAANGTASLVVLPATR